MMLGKTEGIALSGDFLSPIYPITPAGLQKEDLLQWVDALLGEGCSLLQYRRKSLRDLDQLQELEAVLERTHRCGARVIVDDRCDLCRISGADGVHLGQSDLPPRHARAFLGPRALIGLSTHNLAQVESGLREPVDYLALGPVFATRTKDKPDAIVSADLQKDALQMGTKPMAAIGGITPERAGVLWKRGFQSVAVISALEHKPRSGWREFMLHFGGETMSRSEHGS